MVVGLTLALTMKPFFRMCHGKNSAVWITDVGGESSSFDSFTKESEISWVQFALLGNTPENKQ